MALIVSEPISLLIDSSLLVGKVSVITYINPDNVLSSASMLTKAILIKDLTNTLISIGSTANVSTISVTIRKAKSSIVNNSTTLSVSPSEVIKRVRPVPITTVTGNISLSTMIYDTIRANLTVGSAIVANTIKNKMVGKALISVKTNMSAYYYHRAIREDMMSYIPEYYGDSYEGYFIQQTKANEMIRLNVALLDIQAQFVIETSTWGLDKWEELFNLKDNKDLSYEERREAILLRKNTYGVISDDFFKLEAEKFYESIMLQHYDIYENEIEICGSYRAIRESFLKYEQMLNHLRNILPAHLGLNITTNLVTWNELSNADIRFGDLKENNLTWNRFISQYYEPMYIWGEYSETPIEGTHMAENTTFGEIELLSWGDVELTVTNDWDEWEVDSATLVN